MKEDKVYRAGIYLRLSREDGDKAESNSVQTQRTLIQSFLKKKKDIFVVSEKIDDGFSGVSFERPAFRALMEEIKRGTINCVVVKDLSRFGRNYLEAGRYIEQIFPFLGVRFIAVNDNIDTAQDTAYENYMIVPFKNLLNDAYSRDISIKVRSQLEARQKNGEFVGAFPVYGYRRSSGNKHRLVMDASAADMVKKIFAMRIGGWNNLYIARYLNHLGIPSPVEYKEGCASNYATPFKLNPKAKWSPGTVDRILKNAIYTGDLIQGKETTFSYKLKKRVKKPEEAWIKRVNTHEAIIPREDFEIAQQIMQNDTRTAPQQKRLYPLSGMLKCGDCGSNMVRKTARAGGKAYTYYICGTNKANKWECSSHRIREALAEEALQTFFQKQITLFEQSVRLREREIQTKRNEKEAMEKLLNSQKEELSRNKELIRYLYEDFCRGLLTEEEYFSMKFGYEEICSALAKSLEALLCKKKELEAVKEGGHENASAKNNNVQMERTAVVVFFEKLIVLDSKTIRVIPRFQDELMLFAKRKEELR